MRCQHTHEDLGQEVVLSCSGTHHWPARLPAHRMHEATEIEHVLPTSRLQQQQPGLRALLLERCAESGRNGLPNLSGSCMRSDKEMDATPCMAGEARRARGCSLRCRKITAAKRHFAGDMCDLDMAAERCRQVPAYQFSQSIDNRRSLTTHL